MIPLAVFTQQTLHKTMMIPGPDSSSIFDSESTVTELILKPTISENASDTHTRTGENSTKIWLGAIIPLIPHFLSVVGDFNLHHRVVLTDFSNRIS